jgi:O-antigen/teichoic acid export membrane protein
MVLLCVFLIPIGLLILPIVGRDNDMDIIAAAPWIMALYLPSYFAALYVANMFQGKLDLAVWNAIRAVVPTAYAAGLFAMWLFQDPDPRVFAMAYVVSMALSALLGLPFLVRRGWFGLRPEREEAQALVLFGLKSHASEVLHSLRLKLDQMIVDALMSATQFGLYTVALTVANGTMILVQTVANIALPQIGSRPTPEEKIVSFGRFLRLTLAMVIAVDLVLFATNWFVIPLLFGEAFAPSVQLANVLLVGLLPYAVKTVFATALKAHDRALAIPSAEIWGLAVIAVFLFILVPLEGALGAAIAAVIAQLASATVLGFSLSRALRINVLRSMIPTRDDVALAQAYVTRMIGRG